MHRPFLADLGTTARTAANECGRSAGRTAHVGGSPSALGLGDHADHSKMITPALPWWDQPSMDAVGVSRCMR